MSATRRSILAAAGASLATLGSARMTRFSDSAPLNPGADEIAGLIRRSEDSNAALMRGDIDRYREVITLTDDFTLMSPFGGVPTRGTEVSSEQWAAMGRFFRNGTLELELVQSYGSADMVVLAFIERAHVEVGGLPAQEWPLRVTLVYRRDGPEWRLAHRHADPLAKGISLQRAAAIARGEPACPERVLGA